MKPTDEQIITLEAALHEAREALEFYCVEEGNHWHVHYDLCGGKGVGGKKAREALNKIKEVLDE